MSTPRMLSASACFVLCLLISACSTVSISEGNRACTHNTDLPGGGERCFGSFDVYYGFENGTSNGGTPYTHTYYNPKIADFYVAQSGASECYAASLATAFNYYGFKYRKEQFSAAAREACPYLGKASANFAQFMYAATDVHLQSGGETYISTPERSVFDFIGQLLRPVLQYHFVRDGEVVASNQAGDVFIKEGMCQAASGDQKAFSRYHAPVLPTVDHVRNASGTVTPHYDFSQPNREFTPNTALDLYRPITWQRVGKTETAGGLVPVRHPGDLIHHFAKGTAVIAGLNMSGTGHTVILTEIQYSYDEQLKPHLTGLDALQQYENVRIRWVEVIDPGRPKNPRYKIDGDVFLSATTFMIALYEQHQ